VAVTNGSGRLQDGTGNQGCGKNNGLSGVAYLVAAAQHSAGPAASLAQRRSYLHGIERQHRVPDDFRVDYNINAKQKLYFRISRDAGVQASSTSPINPRL
jgi:hypothetical protein